MIPAPPPGPPFAVSSEELQIVKPIDTWGTIHTKEGPRRVQIGMSPCAELDFSRQTSRTYRSRYGTDSQMSLMFAKLVVCHLIEE